MIKLQAKDIKYNFFFAPMEGITDQVYRVTILELYPLWKKVYTDFFRVPTAARFGPHTILNHIGERTYQNKDLLSKTVLQILTTPKAQTQKAAEIIEELSIPHLDLNLGCPSKRVNSHGGGAILLQSPENIQSIVATIRKHYTGTFSVKLRSGYNDCSQLFKIVHILKNEGVDSITLHSRTRKQLYKGVADWSLFPQVKQEISPLPFIPNGDIWSIQDALKMGQSYFLYNQMLARGALKTPWFPHIFHQGPKDTLKFRSQNIPIYFQKLESNYREMKDLSSDLILKRFKAVARYIFDDYETGEEIKRTFLRSKNLLEAQSLLENL